MELSANKLIVLVMRRRLLTPRLEKESQNGKNGDM
jgi:hypothetical protein